ncbi:MAG: Flp pilus assembly complex ATPase component TadA [Planctomycetes bacterium]|nr:Flp pilus assembly complex ATPase component TadA [Planctomycetota bacterium]
MGLGQGRTQELAVQEDYGSERKLIGAILIEMGVLDEATLQQGLEQQREKGVPIGQILIEMGVISEEDLLSALATQHDMPPVDLRNVQIAPEVIQMVSVSMAQMYQIVPIEFDGGELRVAMADPRNVNALDDLRFILNCNISGAVASPQQIKDAIDHYYGDQTESMKDLLDEMSPDELSQFEGKQDSGASARDIENMANAAPVVKFLNLVLLTAIKDQASDIHFEPFENEFRIRYRIDGTLLEITPPPRQLALALVSRIKVMANMDIAERRIPQDNRIELVVGGNKIDLRVSTLPTVFGESTVMRVLDRSVVALDLERLGMREEELEFFKGAVDQPNGIVLVTGPTGSGKTTTLYSVLNEANQPDIKIITTEDPVEYDLDGIVQVPIREDIGVTYAACLRSILRQDPDKILVGEIRDLETAEIAIEASLTGHLVFSTLHTNDAPSTITRMLDMGIEPFLVSATLHSVVAQRLVRVICSKCKTTYAPTEEQLMEINLRTDDVGDRTFYYGNRCENCNKTGFRGRCAIFEIMKIDPKMRELIMGRKSTEVLRAEAQSSGMRTLRESGILKVFDGQTTIEEVVRETLSFD